MRLPRWLGYGQCIPRGAEKVVLTISLCFLNVGWGTIVVIPGPTLMDLQRLIGGPPSTMNLVFLARTIGYLLSAPLGGLTTKYSLQMAIVISSVVIAVTALGIPWCPIIWQMTTLFGIHGLALGVFDIVTTVLLIKMWEEHKAPYIQMFNVIGYLGSLVAPTLARPFISSQDDDLNVNKSVLHDIKLQRKHFGLPMWQTDYTGGRNALETEDTSNLKGLFAILAVYELVAGFAFYVLMVYFKDLQKYDKYVSEPDLQGVDADRGEKSGWCYVITIILLSMCMQFLAGGEVALSVGSYGAEYIIQYYKGTLDDATLASTIFAASMVLSGIVCVALLKFIRTNIIIKSCVFVQGLGALFFLGGALNYIALCIGLAVVAVALASFTTANICWATDRIGRPALVASVVALGYPLGEMLFPLIIGLHFNNDPNSLIYCMFGNAMILVFVFTVGEIIRTSAQMGKFTEMTVELDGFWDKVRGRFLSCGSCCEPSDKQEDQTLLIETPSGSPKISGYLVQPDRDVTQ